MIEKILVNEYLGILVSITLFIIGVVASSIIGLILMEDSFNPFTIITYYLLSSILIGCVVGISIKKFSGRRVRRDTFIASLVILFGVPASYFDFLGHAIRRSTFEKSLTELIIIFIMCLSVILCSYFFPRSRKNDATKYKIK